MLSISQHNIKYSLQHFRSYAFFRVKIYTDGNNEYNGLSFKSADKYIIFLTYIGIHIFKAPTCIVQGPKIFPGEHEITGAKKFSAHFFQ